MTLIFFYFIKMNSMDVMIIPGEIFKQFELREIAHFFEHFDDSEIKLENHTSALSNSIE